MIFKLLTRSIFLLVLPFIGWAVETTLTVHLKDGSQAIIRPITGAPEDKKAMYSILKDPDTCRTMRDGTIWPDQSIDNTYAYYVANWQTFKDLESLGIKDHKLTFGFLIFSREGTPMGLGGIQNSTRNEPYNELYFAFLPAYRHKGLGKQFGQFLMKFDHSVFGDRILEAIILPDNIPSKKLMIKLGFSPRLDPKGKPLSHRFSRWGNRLYEIYRYTPKLFSSK
jgi:RimJ/RimL family protein N-acetyltransferase